MEKIQFDDGVKEYRLGNSGVLRFNPGDPNLYARFMEAAEKIAQVEKEMADGGKDGSDIVKLLKEADGKMKAILSWVFGQNNDFDKILGGVNLLAVGKNGSRVVSNLFDALQPILLNGARACAMEKTQQAVQKAGARRASQTAAP